MQFLMTSEGILTGKGPRAIFTDKGLRSGIFKAASNCQLLLGSAIGRSSAAKNRTITRRSYGSVRVSVGIR